MDSKQRMTVQEAAQRLGVKEDAIRKRIQRGSLQHDKDPKDGRVYVYVDSAQDTTYDATQGGTEDASYATLVDTLNDQIGYLRGVIDTRDRELETRAEELRRKDHIIAALTERIPELEPAREASPEPRESPENASTDDEGVEMPPKEEKPISWWRRLFGEG